MTGVVTGGWEFVWAAYAITGTVLLVYCASVLLRYRKEVSGAAPVDEENR